MDWQHPVLQEMLQMGCSDTSRVMFAFQSYMNLCEVDVSYDVGFAYDSELDLIYLTSRDGSERTVHLPAPAAGVSPAWLAKAQARLLPSHPDTGFNVLLKTPDTTILPYRLSKGLCPPPESSKEKKSQHEKKHFIRSELNKRRSELYEEAKRKRAKPEQDVDDSETMLNSDLEL